MGELTRKERERVLSDVVVCAESWEPDARLLGNVRAGDIAALRNCTPVPTDYLDRLERALWLAMEQRSPIDLLVEMGLFTQKNHIDATTGIPYTTHDWTPAAHEFAERMREKTETERSDP